MMTLLSVLGISLFVVGICFITASLFLYIYSQKYLNFGELELFADVDVDEEWSAIMDAREGGLSRHWYWDD